MLIHLNQNVSADWRKGQPLDGGERQQWGHPIEQWDSIRGRVMPHPQPESSITHRDTWKRRKTQRKREKHKTGEILVSEERKQTMDKPD